MSPYAMTPTAWVLLAWFALLFVSSAGLVHFVCWPVRSRSREEARRARERERAYEENHWHLLDTPEGKQMIADVKARLKQQMQPVPGETPAEAEARMRKAIAEGKAWMFLTSDD